MSIPDFQALMLPVLPLAGDGAEHQMAAEGSTSAVERT
jgi:restriction endonuclease Mrr